MYICACVCVWARERESVCVFFVCVFVCVCFPNLQSLCGNWMHWSTTIWMRISTAYNLPFFSPRYADLCKGLSGISFDPFRSHTFAVGCDNGNTYFMDLRCPPIETAAAIDNWLSRYRLMHTMGLPESVSLCRARKVIGVTILMWGRVFCSFLWYNPFSLSLSLSLCFSRRFLPCRCDS